MTSIISERDKRMEALNNSLYKAFYFFPNPTLIVHPYGDEYLVAIRAKGCTVTGLQVVKATIGDALNALSQIIDEEYPGESCGECRIPATEHINGRDYCQSCYNAL